jgi:hypothetical protein
MKIAWIAFRRLGLFEKTGSRVTPRPASFAPGMQRRPSSILGVETRLPPMPRPIRGLSDRSIESQEPKAESDRAKEEFLLQF